MKKWFDSDGNIVEDDIISKYLEMDYRKSSFKDRGLDNDRFVRLKKYEKFKYWENICETIKKNVEEVFDYDQSINEAIQKSEKVASMQEKQKELQFKNRMHFLDSFEKVYEEINYSENKTISDVLLNIGIGKKMVKVDSVGAVILTQIDLNVDELK